MQRENERKSENQGRAVLSLEGGGSVVWFSFPFNTQKGRQRSKWKCSVTLHHRWPPRNRKSKQGEEKKEEKKQVTSASLATVALVLFPPASSSAAAPHSVKGIASLLPLPPFSNVQSSRRTAVRTDTPGARETRVRGGVHSLLFPLLPLLWLTPRGAARTMCRGGRGGRAGAEEGRDGSRGALSR